MLLAGCESTKDETSVGTKQLVSDAVCRRVTCGLHNDPVHSEFSWLYVRASECGIRMVVIYRLGGRGKDFACVRRRFTRSLHNALSCFNSNGSLAVNWGLIFYNPPFNSIGNDRFPSVPSETPPSPRIAPPRIVPPQFRLAINNDRSLKQSKTYW